VRGRKMVQHDHESVPGWGNAKTHTNVLWFAMPLKVTESPPVCVYVLCGVALRWEQWHVDVRSDLRCLLQPRHRVCVGTRQTFPLWHEQKVCGEGSVRGAIPAFGLHRPAES